MLDPIQDQAPSQRPDPIIPPTSVSVVSIFQPDPAKIQRQQARALKRAERATAKVEKSVTSAAAAAAAPEPDMDSIVQDKDLDNSCELFTYLEEKNKKAYGTFSFAEVNPVQQAMLIHQQRTDPEFYALLEQHLIDEPNFLHHLMQYSIDNFMLLIESRIAYLCTNTQIAVLIIYHQTEMLELLEHLTHDPIEKTVIYLRGLEKTLKTTGKVLEQWLDNPESQNILLTSSIFSNYSLAKVSETDFYQVLKVPRHATVPEIEEALFENEVDDTLSDLNLRIRAIEILANPIMRPIYDHHHPDAGLAHSNEELCFSVSPR